MIILIPVLLAMATAGGAPGDLSCCGYCIDGCLGPQTVDTASTLYKFSSELFYGTVIAQDLLTCCYIPGEYQVMNGRADIMFDVIRQWKGARVQRIKVRTPPCQQLHPFILGRNYLVSALPGNTEEPPFMGNCYLPLEGVVARSTMAELDNIAQADKNK